MNARLITIYCRRCLGEISHCEPGALIGCAMGCRLFTRATEMHTRPPALTRIKVRPVVMGFELTFTPGADFTSILDEFKLAIPKSTRRYLFNEKWWIATRVRARLDRFLSSVAARADVIVEEAGAVDRRAS